MFILCVIGLFCGIGYGVGCDGHGPKCKTPGWEGDDGWWRWTSAAADADAVKRVDIICACVCAHTTPTSRSVLLVNTGEVRRGERAMISDNVEEGTYL
jgi:hypothetical protein